MATWSNSDAQLRSVPVRRGAAEIVYASSTAQIKDLYLEIKRWEDSIQGIPGPIQRDSLELAYHGLRRWDESHALKRTANSIKRLKEMIKDNPHVEVRALAVARANWLRTRKIIGLCSFRRTWCNNISLDVIAVHPGLDEMQESPISGLGTGFIHHICAVAETIGAEAIWGECTQNTADFYAIFVDMPANVPDLIIVPPSIYQPLKNTIEVKWKSAEAQKSNL
jgi:hypothetical protein